MGNNTKIETIDACDAEVLADFVANHWESFTAHVVSYRSPDNSDKDAASTILNSAPYSSTGDQDLDMALFILSRLKTAAEYGTK